MRKKDWNDVLRLENKKEQHKIVGMSNGEGKGKVIIDTQRKERALNRQRALKKRGLHMPWGGGTGSSLGKNISTPEKGL